MLLPWGLLEVSSLPLPHYPHDFSEAEFSRMELVGNVSYTLARIFIQGYYKLVASVGARGLSERL